MDTIQSFDPADPATYEDPAYGDALAEIGTFIDDECGIPLEDE